MREFVRDPARNRRIPEFDLLQLNPAKLQAAVGREARCSWHVIYSIICFRRKVKRGISNYSKIIDKIQSQL